MNDISLRRCIKDKETLATAYLATMSAKECSLYERDLEWAIESWDELTRENDPCLILQIDGDM
jgi:hypothetical protein